jgi:uncharacterized protein (TIGR03435 family)
MAVGFLHPAVVLPETLIAELSAPELEHVLMHEVAHIARRDDWTNLAARLLAAALALHPVAWWILRQIEREREIACDDWVVARTGSLPADARAYAESLARLSELRWARKEAAAGNALASGIFGGGSRVGERIELLLGRGREVSGRASGGRVAMSIAALLGFVITASIAPRWVAFAQARLAVETPAVKRAEPREREVSVAAPPRGRLMAPQIVAQSEGAVGTEFEVASVRAAKPGQGGGRGGNGPSGFKADPGMLAATNITLKELFRQAYGLKEYQLAGGPVWLGSATYDVNAKSATASTPDELRVMLRKLLADRLQLKFHIETKEEQVMALVVAKSGPKFHEAQGGAATDAGGEPFTGPLGMSPFFQKIRMETLATVLSGACGTLDLPFGPVVDMTGLKGEYDLRMTTKPNPDSGPRTMLDQVCEALPQLGLEFKRQKVPIEMYVIDSAEKVPTEN